MEPLPVCERGTDVHRCTICLQHQGLYTTKSIANIMNYTLLVTSTFLASRKLHLYL